MRALPLGLSLCLLGACSARSSGPVYSLDAEAVEPPAVITEVKPRYTPEAMSAGIEGRVTLEAVVLADGTVGEVVVTQSLDQTLGLDEQAIEAVRLWQFAPGTRLGEPVNVLVSIEIAFALGHSVRSTFLSGDHGLMTLLDREPRLGTRLPIR
jgi:protein TonB